MYQVVSTVLFQIHYFYTTCNLQMVGYYTMVKANWICHSSTFSSPGLGPLEVTLLSPGIALNFGAGGGLEADSLSCKFIKSLNRFSNIILTSSLKCNYSKLMYLQIQIKRTNRHPDTCDTSWVDSRLTLIT